MIDRKSVQVILHSIRVAPGRGRRDVQRCGDLSEKFTLVI